MLDAQTARGRYTARDRDGVVSKRCEPASVRAYDPVRGLRRRSHVFGVRSEVIFVGLVVQQ